MAICTLMSPNCIIRRQHKSTRSETLNPLPSELCFIRNEKKAENPFVLSTVNLLNTTFFFECHQEICKKETSCRTKAILEKITCRARGEGGYRTTVMIRRGGEGRGEKEEKKEEGGLGNGGHYMRPQPCLPHAV